MIVQSFKTESKFSRSLLPENQGSYSPFGVSQRQTCQPENKLFFSGMLLNLGRVTCKGSSSASRPGKRFNNTNLLLIPVSATM